MENVILSNGLSMPMEGFGVFQVPDADVCEQAVLDALSTGYRLIDTAAAYMNEKAVGNAIKKSGIDRSEIFVTTKLWVQDFGYKAAKKAIQTCLDNLQTDYIDLLLLHQPFGDIFGAWRAMEEAYKAGKLKAIGVSNFYPFMLENFLLHVDIKPMVNQIEIHPFFIREKDLEFMKANSIQPEAWGPLAEGKFGIFTNPILEKIAARYNKSVAQVVLRWDIERGVVVIPKSTHKNRIDENFNIWDFSLTPEEIAEINSLDKGHSEIVDHFDPAFVKMVSTLKVHD